MNKISPLEIPILNSDIIWHLELSKCNKYLACCAADNSLTIYSYPSLQLTNKIQTSHSKSIRKSTFSPLGRIIAVCSFSKDFSIYIFVPDEKLADCDRHIYTLDGPGSEIKHIEFNSKGDKVVIGCRDGSIWMYQFEVDYAALNILEIKNEFLLKEPECVAIMEQAHQGDIKCIRFLNEYETVSVGFDEQIRIHTETDCEFEQKVNYEFDEVTKSTLWDIEVLNKDDTYIYMLIAHSNGILSLMKYNYKEFWFKLMKQMKVHTRDIYELAYRFKDDDYESDEIIVATSGGDNCVKVSKIKGMKTDNVSIEIEHVVSNGEYEVNSVIIGMDDETKKNYVVYGGDDKQIKYFELV